MKMKKLLALLLALVMVVAMVACGAKKEEAPAADAPAADAPAADAPAAKDEYVIGISMDTQNSAYWEAMMVGIDEAVAELGNVKVEYLVAEGNSDMQNQQISTFVSKGVDAIICVPKDAAACMTAVAEANAAGIPFIWCDRSMEGMDTETTWVDFGCGTDNYQLTRMGAEWLVEHAKEKGVTLYAIEFQGSLTDPNAIARSNAFQDVAKENSDVLTIVSSVPTDWDCDMAYGAMKSALAANPEINCVLGACDGFWPPVANALQELGLSFKSNEAGHVYYISVDGEPYTIRAIEQGYVDGIMCQPIIESAKTCVKAAVTLASGGTLDSEYEMAVCDTITQENFEEIGYTAYGYAGRMEYDYEVAN